MTERKQNAQWRRREGRHVMIRAFVVILLLGGCSSLLPVAAGLVTGAGGGTNVAANTQVGAENRQTLTLGGNSEITQTLESTGAEKVEQSTGKTGVRTDRVETLVVQERVPSWIWISWAILLMMDSPLRWPGQVWGAMKRVFTGRRTRSRDNEGAATATET